jgi:hypothetical protein
MAHRLEVHQQKASGSDSVMIALPAGSFNIGALATDMYSNGMAKISKAASTTLNGHPEIFTLGYGGVAKDNRTFGTLRFAWTNVTSASAGRYNTASGTGESCKGDSGGADLGQSGERADLIPRPGAHRPPALDAGAAFDVDGKEEQELRLRLTSLWSLVLGARGD